MYTELIVSHFVFVFISFNFVCVAAPEPSNVCLWTGLKALRRDGAEPRADGPERKVTQRHQSKATKQQPKSQLASYTAADELTRHRCAS